MLVKQNIMHALSGRAKCKRWKWKLEARTWDVTTRSVLVSKNKPVENIMHESIWFCSKNHGHPFQKSFIEGHGGGGERYYRSKWKVR